jgi:hypothetical protein
MLILRLTTYLFIMILACETIALSAVAWSFYESVSNSFSLLKYTSDNKARDLLATAGRVAETKMYVEGYEEMSDFFVKLIKNSEKDLDKFTIKEIFLLSTDGIVLSHSEPTEVAMDVFKRNPSPKYNKPLFMRALRMRKGQLPVPQVSDKSYKGDDTFFGKIIIQLFPDLAHQTILLSAPIYHTDKLETIGSIHLFYNRGNILFFIENQRELFVWMFMNYTVIALLVSFILWTLHMLFTFATYKQGVRNGREIPDPEIKSTTLNKLATMVEKQEDTLKRFLSPIAAKLDITEGTSNVETVYGSGSTGLSQKIASVNEKSVHYGQLNLNSGNGKYEEEEFKKENATEAIDAIYLD